MCLGGRGDDMIGGICEGTVGLYGTYGSGVL